MAAVSDEAKKASRLLLGSAPNAAMTALAQSSFRTPREAALQLSEPVRPRRPASSADIRELRDALIAQSRRGDHHGRWMVRLTVGLVAETLIILALTALLVLR
jgi:hypothetical protein